MVLDGFNIASELNGEQFIFRPLVESERKLLGETLRTLPEHLAERLIRKTIADHLVYAPWGVTVFEMDDETAEQLKQIVFYTGREQEGEDEANLAEYVGLESKYPWLAHSSCQSCRTWWWNPKTGELAERNGEALRRPADMELMCECSTCPKGHWSKPIELSERNRLAYAHYQTCEASGSFPQDEVVKRTARIVRANTGQENN